MLKEGAEAWSKISLKAGIYKMISRVFDLGEISKLCEMLLNI